MCQPFIFPQKKNNYQPNNKSLLLLTRGHALRSCPDKVQPNSWKCLHIEVCFLQMPASVCVCVFSFFPSKLLLLLFFAHSILIHEVFFSPSAVIGKCQDSIFICLDMHCLDFGYTPKDFSSTLYILQKLCSHFLSLSLSLYLSPFSGFFFFDGVGV
jgi:hypothetical protein